MKKTLLKAFFIGLFFVSSSGFAKLAPNGELDWREKNSISSKMYLRKLTAFLSGRAPTESEFEKLEQAQASLESLEAFMDSKIEALLIEPGFARKLSYHLEDLFQVKNSRTAAPANDTLTQKFLDIAEQNKSWDELLISKNYSLLDVPKAKSGFFQADIEKRVGVQAEYTFLSRFTGKNQQFDLEEEIPGFNLDFTSDDRFAGALTTNRFFKRYGNTALNKNRRRAAAVFRMFLCDNMSAAVPETSSDIQGLLKLSFPNYYKTEAQLVEDQSQSAEVLHGTQKDCMACHYKLDPMGKVFGPVGIVLSKSKSGGALSFKKDSGELLFEKVQSVYGLAQKIIGQKEYLSCQTRHFWNWYIGSDLSLSDDRQKALIENFEKFGRKPKDFIRYLVRTSEFKTFTSQVNPLADLGLKAKAILTKCESCHSAKGGVTLSDYSADVPVLTKWPIGGNSEAMNKWLRKNIQAAMDLTAEKGKRTMPPATSPWQPNIQDMITLKAWIEAGAPNEKGNIQIEAGPL